MENYNLHRRAQSGWHPTSYSRKPTPDAPQERNYAAILEAAKRKPVGYWEDAPRGMKFSGEASARSPEASEVGGLSKTPTHAAAPSASSDDLYEPIGTMPVVGDRVRGWGEDLVVSGFDIDRKGQTKFSNGNGCETSYFSKSTKHWRILKRQPRKQVDGRVWRHKDGDHKYVEMPSGCYYFGRINSWEAFEWPVVKESSLWSELTPDGPEADAIIRECVSAMAKGATS